MLQTNILFLDETNNDRSIMAEAYFNRGLNNAVRAFSAGFEPADRLDRHVFDVLRGNGIAPEDYCPKPVDIFLQAYSPRIDLVVGFEPARGAHKRPIFPYNPPVTYLKVPGSFDRIDLPGHRKRAVRETYADLRLAIDRAVATGLLPGSMAA
ncbi:Protein-tyrosine-phosphatase [Cohaesibacter marisflavi]|uniref:Protein-tyrosine-phosphatase n=1 Tax=Cohaesibacter marisflavi TaxID=655353 RepID=A0A1I5JGB4_9HYPH|nr:hypothetical protein [Cohaesibacter marisflavi]SFO71822.1 Protein-tyrosine-phosphatase [Cohaesibacter marisflavi]